jgi:hypothetical protein
MKTANSEGLKAHILPLSVSSVFNVAQQEWELVGVEISDQFDNCPCGRKNH